MPELQVGLFLLLCLGPPGNRFRGTSTLIPEEGGTRGMEGLMGLEVMSGVGSLGVEGG